MEIVCIKAQTIRKATEESEQKKVQYKVLGKAGAKQSAQNKEGFSQKVSFPLGPAFLYITWKPKPAQKF